MYNRYIAQPDGSFQRKRMQDPRPPRPPQPPLQEKPCPPPEPEPEIRTPKPPRYHRKPKAPEGGTNGFLGQLLPKDFDMGDLMIVLLLLVMAGDSKEEHNTALLTLALYLFM